MWEYRKEIIIAMVSVLIIFFYTILMKDIVKDKEAIYIYLLNNIFFMILLSMIIFYILYQRYNVELIAYRFYKTRDFVLFEILSIMKSLGIFFIMIVLGQIFIFCYFDTMFYIMTFLYRYFVLFLLFTLVGMIVFIGRRKNYMKRNVILFIGWNVFYMVFCIFPNSLISKILPFVALKHIDVFEISRLIILCLIAICYALQTDGRKMIEC